MITQEVYSTPVGQERVPEIDGCYEVIKMTGQFSSMKVKFKRQNAGTINSKPQNFDFTPGSSRKHGNFTDERVDILNSQNRNKKVTNHI